MPFARACSSLSFSCTTSQIFCRRRPYLRDTIIGRFQTFSASNCTAVRFLGPSNPRKMYATFSQRNTQQCYASSQASKDHLMLVSDLDLTMVDHNDSTHTALLNFNLLWAAEYAYNSYLVYSSGRSLERYTELQRDAPLLTPQVLILSVGTEIRLGSSLEVDKDWAKELDDGWNRDIIVEEALKIPSLRFQEEPDQGPHKVSFKVDKAKGEDLQKMLSTRLSERGLRVKVLYSSGIDLDVLPHKAGKGQALAYLTKKLSQEDISHKNVLVCGDSGNDIDLFTVDGVHGVIVSNAQEELVKWHQSHGLIAKVLRASRRCAGGIMEALQHFRFGPHLSPNESIIQDYDPTFSSSKESSLPRPGAVYREVVQLKLFMMKWLLSQVSNTEKSFGRLSGVISDGAKTISPEGVELNAAQFLCGMRKKYGSIQGSELRIWFDNIHEQILAEGIYLVTWQLWEQSAGGKRRGYFASAVLKLKAGTPNGVEWLHSHESVRSTAEAV
eukprot:c17033_g1_i1 orf=244-1737(-)